MSLTRPILLQVPSFDATKSKIFTFNYSGDAGQVVANRLTIRKQTDNMVVYERTVSTLRYENEYIPTPEKPTLENGGYYNATVVVIDGQGQESPASTPIQFRCYTTPTLKFTNIPESGIIANSSFNFEFTYDQVEKERLASYVVNLYSTSNKIIATSGDVYAPNEEPPLIMSYLFTGFVDDTAYDVEVDAVTVNGATLTTGKVRFNVDYKQPDLFTLLELEKNCDDGYITVSSNIILIDGVFSPDPPKFINHKEIDLTGDGDYIAWPKGYTIDGNFLARLWFRKPNDYSTIAMFSTADGRTIQVDFMKGYENIEAPNMKAYVQVIVKSVDKMSYYIHSNYINPLSDNRYYNLQLEEINGIYQVKLIDIKEVQ